MTRYDRALGIVLALRGGRAVSAADLAARFEVTRRTIYRDVEALSALGVPVYSERGPRGGFRLLDGYFLPPLTFGLGEALSLLIGLALVGSLPSRPFAAELAAAEAKLLAAVPERLRATLAGARRLIGFESAPDDAFHPEPPAAPSPPGVDDGRVAEAFLRALLERRRVALRYRSPYRAVEDALAAEPLGLFWDRGRWYLVGVDLARPAGAPRLWRADRALAIEPGEPLDGEPRPFDVRALLGRRWLTGAMARWRDEAPVRLRMTAEQAARLGADWYYRAADFAAGADGRVEMTYGEDDPTLALALVRWLGPGAELVEPAAWRERLADELRAMAAAHGAPDAAS